MLATMGAILEVKHLRVARGHTTILHDALMVCAGGTCAYACGANNAINADMIVSRSFIAITPQVDRMETSERLYVSHYAQSVGRTPVPMGYVQQRVTVPTQIATRPTSAASRHSTSTPPAFDSPAGTHHPAEARKMTVAGVQFGWQGSTWSRDPIHRLGLPNHPPIGSRQRPRNQATSLSAPGRRGAPWCRHRACPARRCGARPPPRSRGRQ